MLGNVSINDFKWNTCPCLSFPGGNSYLCWIHPVDSAPQCHLVLCHSFGSREQKHFQVFSCCGNEFIELIVFRYFTLVLIGSTHSLKLIRRRATSCWLMAEGTGTSNPGGFCSTSESELGVDWAVQGFASLPGPDPALLSGSQGLPPAGTHPVSPGCGMWSRKLILVFFFQTTTPSFDPCVSWVSLCPQGCGGTVSAREPPPSQGPESGIWDGVGTGAIPQGLLRRRGEHRGRNTRHWPQKWVVVVFLSFIVTD